MKLFKKQHFLTFMAVASLMSCNTQNEKPKQTQNTPAPTQSEAVSDDVQKLSEALGHFLGRNLKSPGVQFDINSIIRGMQDEAAGKPSPMTDEEYQKAMANMQKNAFESLSNSNLSSAEEFLRKNADEAGVVEIVPGKLQYMVLKEGTGEVVPEHGSPSINYVGKYIDGTVFGSSENAGGPITVPVDQTIPGFSKGIVGMKEGEKRRLFVHPDMGYGKSGQLPPNSLLIFDVEVVKAEAPEKEDHQDDAHESDEDTEN